MTPGVANFFVGHLLPDTKWIPLQSYGGTMPSEKLDKLCSKMYDSAVAAGCSDLDASRVAGAVFKRLNRLDGWIVQDSSRPSPSPTSISIEKLRDHYRVSVLTYRTRGHPEYDQYAFERVQDTLDFLAEVVPEMTQYAWRSVSS